MKTEVARFEREKEALEERSMLDVAIDEMRAYQMTPKIFKELAPGHPGLLCERHYLGVLFGRQVISDGAYMSAIELQFEEGNRFIHTLIESYTRIKGYLPSVFYVTDEETGEPRLDPRGQPQLKSNVRLQLASAGFRVP